jgi:methionyl-tRNA formyltransferase
MKLSGRKLIFFGNERLISGLETTDAPILRALLKEGYDVRAVVANQTGTRSRHPKPLEVAEIAAAHNIPVHLPEKPMDIYELLRSYGADAGILAAYGRIVPQKIIDLFPFGIINIHPSLLPKYRGPSPIESALLNGDRSTGISIMQLTKAMDAGPVYHQLELHLSHHETAPHLAKTLAELAATELVAALPKIFAGELSAKPQDDSKATYCQLIPKSAGRLEPDSLTALEAQRRVRAYLAYPRVRLEVAGRDLIILRAHVGRHPKTPLDRAFKDGNYLVIEFLVAPSGKTMSAETFAKGYLKA